MSVFKKIMSPLIYATFLALTFFLNTAVLAIIQMELEVELIGTIILLTLFTGITTLIFWSSNKLLIKLEKLKIPKPTDHFRQSIIHYLITILIFSLLLKYGSNSSAQFIKGLIIFLSISLWGVLVNGIFLYRVHNKNKI